jgi:hypothetical protein
MVEFVVRVCIDGNKVIWMGVIRDDSGEVEELLTISRFEGFLQKIR